MSPHHPQDPPSVEFEGPTLVHDRSCLDLSFSDEITLMDDLPDASDADLVEVLVADDEAFLTAGLIDDGLTTEDEGTDLCPAGESPGSAELRFLAQNGLQGLAGLADAEDDAETLFMSRSVSKSFPKPVATPPALPLPLSRRADEKSWLERLPPESRQVLEAARRPMPEWPKANRVDAAVVRPVKRIPSLRA